MFTYCEHQCLYINTINLNPSTSVIIRLFVSEIAQRSVIFLSLCFFCSGGARFPCGACGRGGVEAYGAAVYGSLSCPLPYEWGRGWQGWLQPTYLCERPVHSSLLLPMRHHSRLQRVAGEFQARSCVCLKTSIMSLCYKIHRINFDRMESFVSLEQWPVEFVPSIFKQHFYFL